LLPALSKQPFTTRQQALNRARTLMTITNIENTRHPQATRRTLSLHYGAHDHRRSPVLSRSELRRLVIDLLG